MAKPHITIDLVFDNALHRTLHHILVKHNFTYLVGANRRVGRKYYNLDQHLLVDLLDDDGSIEAAIRATDGTIQDLGHVIVEADYTTTEWQEIKAVGPDVAVMLECEITILIKFKQRRVRS